MPLSLCASRLGAGRPGSHSFEELAHNGLASACALLSGKTFPCRAVDARGSGNWPGTIQFSGTPGAITGEVHWTTLNSIHRIAGSLSGNSLRFTEVSAIKAGSAHLNSIYTLTFANGSFDGKYVDGAEVGRFSIDLSQAMPTPTAAPAAIDLNGSWQSGLLHIWQDRGVLLITATWKRDDGKWVIWKANGRLQGQEVFLEDVLYSPMPHGLVNPEKGHFAVSADGSQLEAYYIVNGKRNAQTFVYHRDR